jgi:hypothetical protein
MRHGDRQKKPEPSSVVERYYIPGSIKKLPGNCTSFRGAWIEYNGTGYEYAYQLDGLADGSRGNFVTPAQAFERLEAHVQRLSAMDTFESNRADLLLMLDVIQGKHALQPTLLL